MSSTDDVYPDPLGMLAVGILGEPERARDLASRVTRLAAPDRVRVIVAAGGAVQAARQAETDGADFLVIADGATCAHLFDIGRAVAIPVVSVIEEVGAEAARRPPAGATVGLLVDDRAAELYRDDLARRGLVVGPPNGSVLLVVDGTVATPAPTEVMEVAQVLAEQVVAYARRERPLPPPFAWTEVGPD